ncbi:MAG TPA: zinc-ribbon domain containing protein [Moraxellaceae bacterium]
MDAPRKSGRQRRLEIRERRRQRALAAQTPPRDPESGWPLGAVAADATALSHNNTYGLLPLYYVDRAFDCRDCGSAELWTAKQQKWWYEEAKGHIDSTAIRCRPCRQIERDRKAEARRVHLEGLARKAAGREL